jgi:polyhydroxyalkanoate synthase
MNAEVPPGLKVDPVLNRLTEEVQRSFQRIVKGVDYLTSPEPKVGLTPKDVLYVRGTQRLARYRPQSDEVYRVPLLIVVAPSNRSYFIDMVPGQSMVEFLLQRGFDVFLLDWLDPSRAESKLKLDDYVTRFIPDAVRRVLKETDQEEISVLGYCAGGLMTACYAALNADGPLKNLVCLTTPIDFEHMTLHRNLVDPRYFDIDTYIDSLNGENVPGEAFYQGSALLRPVTPIADQIRLWDNMLNDQYIKQHRMFDRWVKDPIALPAEYMRQFMKELLVANKLVSGNLPLGGRKVRLGDIEASLLHAIAEHDHLTPRGATKPLVEQAGSKDKEEYMVKGGHISVATGPRAAHRLWPKLENWLGSRSE